MAHYRYRARSGRGDLVEGILEGTITMAERGSGGFGYDSIFVPDDGANP